MTDEPQEAPGLATQIRKLMRTGLGALQNRGELLSVEWQEERARMLEVVVWTVVCLFFGILGVGLLTVFVIFLFPENLRIYAIAGFALLYLAAAILVWTNLKKLLLHEPFAESVAQVRKDAECFESLR